MMHAPAWLSTLAAVAALTAAAPALAEPIPAPSGTLRDYNAIGVIQIEFPPANLKAAPMSAAGEKNDDKPAPAGDKDKSTPPAKSTVPGTFMMFDFQQAFVRPDCYAMVTRYLGATEFARGLANTERTYTAGAGYVVDRAYRNIDPVRDSPMRVARSSMATYGKVFGELTTGKLLPAEDLKALEESLKVREKALRETREKLKQSIDPTDIPLAAAAAAEHARVRDEIDQLDARRLHPCHIVRFDNKDAMEALLAKGLMSGFPAELLDKGTTTVWLTQAEGLPIKMEVTANDGRIALFVMLKQFKINSGIKASDLALPIPPNARLITVAADLREPDWEVAMERELSARIARFEEQRMREKQAEKFVKPRGK